MKLLYGNGVTCELQGGEVIRVHANPLNAIIGHEVALAVQEAFASPIDYPNLASATVPGDTVAIGLDYCTPQMLAVVEGTFLALEHAGVDRAAITVVLAPEFADDEAIQQSLRSLAGADVTFVVHDADGGEPLALLGITAANRSLRLNRVLCDADLVVPIGTFSGDAALADTGGLMFPRFSDRETRGRFHAPGSHETTAAQQKLAAEVVECDWMLGVGLALQIVPGPEGSVAAVYCGTPSGAAKVALECYQEVWATRVNGRADLVVATIVGDETQQTWRNLSRALLAADELVAPGGAIAICSDIATRPGPSGKRLRDAADLADVERKLVKDEYPDSVAALQLCKALQRGTVYLKSRLDPEIVERFGLAPIASDHELERLVQTYQRCVVLEEAQHLLPVLVNHD
jgi:nickel-dependent lactate racemase